MSIPVSEIDPFEVCFTHVHEGVATTIAVERLHKDPDFLKLKPFLTPVEEHFAKWAMENRGVEQKRLDRLTPAIFAQPLTYCEWENGSHLLVDGNHRYVKAAMLGVKELPARVVLPPLWRKYVVSGIPMKWSEAFLTAPSGLP